MMRTVATMAPFGVNKVVILLLELGLAEFRCLGAHCGYCSYHRYITCL
jgi:hypothetical protein